MTLADRIRHARQQKKISQIELAELAKINVKSLSRYELGTTVPPANLLADIANVLGVSTDYLIKGESSTIQDKDLYDKFTKIQSITGEPKKMILNFLEMAIRDAQAKQAYS